MKDYNNLKLMLLASSLLTSLFSTHASTVLTQFPKQTLNRIEQVVSIFENSTTDQVYDYIENIHDGRGYTAGKIGFTTATGDLVLVAIRYLELNPNASTKWSSYIPIIKKLSEDGSDDTSKLKGLPSLWKNSCRDPFFKEAQDQIGTELYMNPAIERLAKCHLTTPLALLVFYDTVVQHGTSDDESHFDPDSFEGVIKKMKTYPMNEKDFLVKFLEARRSILMNASNEETREAWRESVYRVDALLALMDTDKWSLEGKVVVHVWDTDFILH